MKIILKKIQYFRMLRGYSHENIAFELNISQAAYCKIENGLTKLSAERLLKIAEILNVSVIELLQEKIANDHESLFLSKELPNIIIKTKDELITKQQEEIEFLRKMLVEKYSH